jgi:hypothetical protein
MIRPRLGELKLANELVSLPLYPVRFRTSDGQLYDVDYRDIEKAFERDPEGHIVSHDDPDVLLLTADDCVWLCMQGIGF